MESNLREANIISLGLVPYETSLRIQQHLHVSVAAGNIPPVILLVEHPSIVTFGKNSADSALKDGFSGIPTVATDRGGQATAHNPGQAILYPILPLGALRLGAKRYVWLLEEVVIRVLAEYSIIAARDSRYPGVWVSAAKICAIGVRIARRTSMHGIALNVSNSLDIFDAIVPCGIKDRTVTSMQQQTNALLEVGPIARRLSLELCRLLQLDYRELLEPVQAYMDQKRLDLPTAVTV